MNLIVDNVYHLTGEGFAESALEENNNLFKFVRVDNTGDWVFKGVTTGIIQWCCADMIETGEAVIKPVTKEKPKRTKRKKGKGKTAPTVDKMKLLFADGSTYTLKGVLSAVVEDDLIEFTVKQEVKGDVLRSELVTLPTHDLVSLFVRPAKSKPFLVEFEDDYMVVTTPDSRFVCTDFDLVY